MADIPDYDLLNLDDTVFEVQEVVFDNENELFHLNTFLDDFMKKNATAKTDGVFRGRLAEKLRNRSSSVPQVWSMFDNKGAAGLLTAQSLIAPNEMSFVMEHQSCKINESSAKSFIKALRKPDTLNHPKINCCTKVLKEGGEKAAVKHFYEQLQSKALCVEKWQSPDCSKLTYQKEKYNTRQKLLNAPDPSTKCAIIEASMKSKCYNVTNAEVNVDLDESCKCYRCHLDIQSAKPKPVLEEVEEDGNCENCSLYVTDIEETSEHFLYITENFGLSHLCHLNMLTDLNNYYPGVSFPFIYMGGCHSFFPIHIEDMSLWSINFHHKGDPKLFIVVAPGHVEKLSRVLAYSGLSNYHRICIYKLGHKSSVVFPQFLVHHGISFKVIIQRPGDFVFLAPNAAHTGGNMGVNMAEACNVGTPDWLPYGSVAQHYNCSCIDNGVHMDVTSLIKMHRPELLKYHLDKSMHLSLLDVHFQNSVIVPYKESAQEEVPVTDRRALASPTNSSSSSTLTFFSPSNSRGKTVKATKAVVSCPIKGCFKVYKAPIRSVLEKHIANEHPHKVQNKKVQNALEAMFPVVKRSGLRRTCPDCGTEVSVFSNKHQGSASCKKRAAGIVCMKTTTDS